MGRVDVAGRESKRALAQVAELLGTDTVAARTYLRRVQHLAGPAPYDAILDAMRGVEGFDVEQVAALIATGRTGDPGSTDRTSGEAQRAGHTTDVSR